MPVEGGELPPNVFKKYVESSEKSVAQSQTEMALVEQRARKKAETEGRKEEADWDGFGDGVRESEALKGPPGSQGQDLGQKVE